MSPIVDPASSTRSHPRSNSYDHHGCPRGSNSKVDGKNLTVLWMRDRPRRRPLRSSTTPIIHTIRHGHPQADRFDEDSYSHRAHAYPCPFFFAGTQLATERHRPTPTYPDLPRTSLAPSTDAPPPTPTPGSASRSTQFTLVAPLGALASASIGLGYCKDSSPHPSDV